MAPLTSLRIRRRWAPKNWVQSWHMFHYCYAINSTLLEVSHSDCQVEFIFEKISYPSGVLSCLSVCPLGTVTDLHRIGSD